MMNIPTDLLLDGLVAILLGATIFYCAMLDRKLKALRSGQDGLKQTIDQLNTATARAEISISQMKQVSGQLDDGLTQQMRDARTLADELSVMVASGNKVAGQLGTGRPRASASAQTPAALKPRDREKYVPMPSAESGMTPADAGRLEDGLNQTLLDALKRAR
ncbi:MAG: hypothetical protein HEP70_13280 [Rhodobiaceae bacterium]|nr:hypothetical protein [Rhodobiaceae bacterium]